MNTDRKHYYRFKYLKSDHWANLRLRKLAQQRGKCKICKSVEWNHDVHHINYRNLFDVTLSDLVVLCRNCHKNVHVVIEKCQSIKDADTSKSKWHRTLMKVRLLERKREKEKVNEQISKACKEIRKRVRAAKLHDIDESSPVFILNLKTIKKMASGKIPITKDSLINYSNPDFFGKTSFVWR